MDLDTAISARYSVREYSPRAVGRELVDKCLNAARLAPSACNKQPWQFIVVDDPAVKEKLCRAAFDFPPQFNKFAFQAPVITAVCAREDFLTHKVFGGAKKIQYYLLDIGAAVENFMLKAAGLGLGSCWLGWFNEKSVKQVLKIPQNIRVVSLITLGYPAGKGREKNLKNMEEIRSYNSFR